MTQLGFALSCTVPGDSPSTAGSDYNWVQINNQSVLIFFFLFSPLLQFDKACNRTALTYRWCEENSVFNELCISGSQPFFCLVTL